MAQFKKTFDFKSVGQLQADVQTQALQTTSNNPIGILTPVSFDVLGGSLFAMSTDLGDQIRDNMKNLLSTNRGERLMLEDFGANLQELAYDFRSEASLGEATNRIAIAVAKYMPFVELVTFGVSIDQGPDNSTVNTITVVYSVPNLNLDQQVAEVSIVVAN